jgi:UDP-N-acetylmuramoyl-tripeptide--D-alanyl-D-alanine ligase
VDEAVAAMTGELVRGDGGANWQGGALDSRKVRGGELFFALRGATTDGHRFVGQALAAGAAAAVIDRDVDAAVLPPAGALVRVADAYQGLHALTRAIRLETPRHLVGITGSTGKTTTKELLGAVLGRRFRTARSPGNLNNLFGFPIALLSVPDDTEWMVAEMGMSTPGELRGVSLLGRPDVAVYTNVRPVHLEFFGSVRTIAEAKAELLAGLAADGIIVANADDPEVARIAARDGRRVVWYALDGEGDVVAREVEVSPGGRPGSRFALRAGGESVRVELPLHGAYNIENALAAAACGWALGVPLAEVAAALGGATPAAMRGVVGTLPGGGTLIDDSYNSNPWALEQALVAAASLPAARRWAVLGDMLELGVDAPSYHRRAGERAAALGFAPVAAVGPLAGELAAGAGERGRAFTDAAAAAAWAPSELRAGDLVLVKGSRGIGLERVVETLRAAAERR